MDAEPLSHAGRTLLAYHCSGSDTVLGDVNVAGSIAILLAIGFIVGAVLSSLFFWSRLRKGRAYDIEYRERFGSQMNGEVPDVAVIIKSAETPAFRGEQEQEHQQQQQEQPKQQQQQHNVITVAAAAMPEQPVALFLPRASATLTGGPLAAGFNSYKASLDASYTGAGGGGSHAAKPPPFPPLSSSVQLNTSKDYALRRSATFGGPMTRSTSSIPRPTGNPFATQQDLIQVPLPTTTSTISNNPIPVQHRRMASHHSFSLSSDPSLIPAHFGNVPTWSGRRNSVSALQRSQTSALQSPLASGLDTSASVILAESHHRSMSAGPKVPSRSAWDPIPRFSDSNTEDNEDIHCVRNSMNGLIRRASSSTHATPTRELVAMGPLELAASVSGLQLPKFEEPEPEPSLEIFHTPIKSSRSMSTGGTSSEYATPVATIESVKLPQHQELQQEKTPSKPSLEDVEFENPFATTPQSKAAHRAALLELKSSMEAEEKVLRKLSSLGEIEKQEAVQEVKKVVPAEKAVITADGELKGGAPSKVTNDRDDAVVEEERDLEVGQPGQPTEEAVSTVEKETPSVALA